MIFANAELHLPEDLGEIRIEGEMPCSVCTKPMTQADIEDSRLMALTGRGVVAGVAGMALRPRVYVAHVAHFFTINPTNGEVSETGDYRENMLALARAYAKGEGIDETDQRLVM